MTIGKSCTYATYASTHAQSVYIHNKRSQRLRPSFGLEFFMRRGADLQPHKHYITINAYCVNAKSSAADITAANIHEYTYVAEKLLPRVAHAAHATSKLNTAVLK